ncbi:MAG: hypothetical protein ACJAUG_000033 [Halioglobus sp.]|jgi:hypothetical protein
MSTDDKDNKSSSGNRTEVQLGFGSDTFGEKERDLEPVFEDFEAGESFDTAYEDSGESTFENSRYSSEYEDDTLDYDVDPESLMAEEEEFEAGAAATIAAAWQAEQLKPELVHERERERELDDDKDFDYEPEPALAAEPAQKWEGESSGAWPIGLIAVAIIALLLLSAGGYGVMQQRASMQEEIRSLQAAAATSASPKEVTASREVQRVLTDRNKELLNTVDALHMEIRSLRDTTQGLESQLLKLKSDKPPEAIKPKTSPKAVAAAPKQATTPTRSTIPAAVTKPVSTNIASGSWFVNFSSYGASTTANSWVARLRPAYGEVVAIPAVKNGNTFYRVRVVNLSNETQAKEVAQALAKQYKLPTLWIGQQ